MMLLRLMRISSGTLHIAIHSAADVVIQHHMLGFVTNTYAWTWQVACAVEACALSNDCRQLLAAAGKGFVFRYEHNPRHSIAQVTASVVLLDLDVGCMQLFMMCT